MRSPRVFAATAAVLCGAVVLASLAGRLLWIPAPFLDELQIGIAAAALCAALAAAFARPSAPERALLTQGMLECEELACYTLDREGRVRSWSRGAEAMFGWSAAERERMPITGTIHAPRQQGELLAEVTRLFETGRGHPAHRRDVTDRKGRTFETICLLVPLRSRRKVRRVAVLHLDPHSPQLAEGRRHRLFHSAPVGILRLSAKGSVETVNRKLAEWVGRRLDALEGTDVARAEVFPADFRDRLLAETVERKEGEPPPVPFEHEVTLVGADGAPRSYQAFVSPRAGSGADVVLVDGASRQQLLAERDAARAAASAARETATETVATHRDLTSSVEQLMSALHGAHADEPDRRATAEQELERSGRRILADVLRLEEGGRREKSAAAPRVLLVDDNDENLELIAHMLRTKGAEVTPVTSGREALDAVTHAGFDLVLLDLQMPEMDGYEVARRIRALPGGDALSVLALTALGADAVRDRCLSEGMDDIVSKPVTLARIADILARWGKRPRTVEPQPPG